MEFLLAQSTAPSQGVSIIDTLARTPLSKVLIFVAICTALRLVIAPKIFGTRPHERSGGFTALKFLNETLDAIVYAGVVVFMVIRPFAIQAFQIPSPSMYPTLNGGIPGKADDFIVANKAVYRYTHPKNKDIVVFRPPAYACSGGQKDTDGQPKVDFIKRCIGTPGQVIEIRGGVLYRDGKPLNELYRHGTNENDWKLVHYEGSYATWKGRYIPVSIDFNAQPNYAIQGVAKEFAVGAIADPHGDDAPWVLAWKQPEQLTFEERQLINELSQAPAAAIPARHYLMMGDNRQQSFDGRAWGLVTEDQIVGRAEFIWLPFGRWQITR